MSSLTDLREVVDVVIGVDTHVHTHSAAALDARTGGVLDEITVEATADGYAQLVEFADEHAALRAWAIEGTGGHGAGLTRHLERGEEVVIELDRPERARRRHGAKSDPLDAIRAAREALSRPRLGAPAQWRGPAGPLGAAGRPPLRGRRRDRRPAAGVQPGHRRTRADPGAVPRPEAAGHAQDRRRPAGPPLLGRRDHHDRTVLRSLARRARTLTEEAAEHEKAIRAIVRSWRPDLLEQLGVGPIVAATVLCAWSHPGRIHSEAAFAMLAGVAPIPANSGQVTTRYRLNRYGDRQLNRALHTIALSRIRYDQPPATTSPAAPPRARPPARSNAASSATSPETSTGYSNTGPSALDDP